MPALETLFFDIPQIRRGSLMAYLAAAAFVALATGLRLVLGAWLEGASFVTFYLAVIAASLVCGMAAGWLAVVLSALSAWAFIYSPGLAYSHALGIGFFLLVAAANVVVVGALLATIAKVQSLVRTLESSEQKFRGIVESSPEAMVIVDASGIIALVNARVGDVFGYRRDELLGKAVETLVPKRLAERHRQHLARFATDATMRPMGAGNDLYGLRKDGTEFPVEISLSPLHTPQGLYVSSVIRDITQRRQIEAELFQARQLEQEASRAKTLFLSNMSHELRTPLNAVIGFVQLLEGEQAGPLTPKQREYLGYIHDGGTHLLSLVNEVLDLSKIEAGRLDLSIEAVGVHAAMELAHNSLVSLAEKARVMLILRPANGLPDVGVDRLRLHQCLMNLISNAIKYNRPGGTVTLDARRTPDDRIEIAVADTGRGIPTERQRELFQPFQRLGAEHTAIEGTGLGLALTRYLVEAMGGKIGFSSRPGVGSRFWIDFPVLAAVSHPVATVSEARLAPVLTAGPGRSLLYVEDNAMSARLVEAILSAVPGLTVLSASTAQKGLEKAIRHRPDVIILDINLPGLNGYDLLARLRHAPETRDIPVLALTAAALPGDIAKGTAAGFFRYLTKPIDARVLQAAVEDALTEAAA
jgi:protein-histidine pros-kinase